MVRGRCSVPESRKGIRKEVFSSGKNPEFLNTPLLYWFSLALNLLVKRFPAFLAFEGSITISGDAHQFEIFAFTRRTF